MRDTAEVIQWYKTHETASALGYDPDGMCLRICRDARDLEAVHPSAVSAQEATPAKYRVYDPAKIKVGMVGFYDDPRDSNPFGHIVTYVGRVKGEDPSSLSSLLCRTNSVKANEIVVVRGDYFQRYWGDPFIFAAAYLNGVPFTDLLTTKTKPKPKPARAPLLRAAIKDLQKALKWHEEKGNDRMVRALRRDIREIRETIAKM